MLRYLLNNSKIQLFLHRINNQINKFVDGMLFLYLSENFSFVKKKNFGGENRKITCFKIKPERITTVLSTDYNNLKI